MRAHRLRIRTEVREQASSRRSARSGSGWPAGNAAQACRMTRPIEPHIGSRSIGRARWIHGTATGKRLLPVACRHCKSAHSAVSAGAGRRRKRFAAPACGLFAGGHNAQAFGTTWTQPQRPAFGRNQFDALIAARFPLLFAVVGFLLGDCATEIARILTGDIAHHHVEDIHLFAIRRHFDLLEIAADHLHPCRRLQADPVQVEHAKHRQPNKQASKFEKAKIQDRDDALTRPGCQWAGIDAKQCHPKRRPQRGKGVVGAMPRA